MPWQNYRDESRKQWGVTQNGSLDIEQINCGAMLRIADAVEKMASSVTGLIDKNVRLKQQNETLIRSNRALRAINRKHKTNHA